MLTKIKDGWWCNLENVVDFKTYINPELQEDHACGHIIFNGVNTNVRLMTKELCETFEKALEQYYLNKETKNEKNHDGNLGGVPYLNLHEQHKFCE